MNQTPRINLHPLRPNKKQSPENAIAILQDTFPSLTAISIARINLYPLKTICLVNDFITLLIEIERLSSNKPAQFINQFHTAVLNVLNSSALESDFYELAQKLKNIRPQREPKGIQAQDYSTQRSFHLTTKRGNDDDSDL